MSDADCCSLLNFIFGCLAEGRVEVNFDCWLVVILNGCLAGWTFGVTPRVVKEGMLDKDLKGFVGRVIEELLIGQSASDVERKLKHGNVEEQVTNEELGLEKGLMDDGKL